MKVPVLAAALTGFVLLGAPATPVSAQSNRHLILFRDKANSPYSTTQPQQFLSARAIQRRQRQSIAVSGRDLPPNPAYVQQVRGVAGVSVLYRTRWFNGVMVECDSAKLTQLRALSCVAAAKTLNRPGRRPRPPRPPRVDPDAQRALAANYYGEAFAQADQLGAVDMHNAGFKGDGMHIAVFDAGFPGVNTIPAFQPLFQQGRIGSTYDFVDNDQTVYEKYDHGTEVLSCIGANQPNRFVGTAPNATFHLYITEDVTSEHPIEEANWLMAAEYADSVGVDVISSSLGYTTFDPPSTSYTYADMNGHTAISTRAADFAAAAGILVVNSAGNEGSSQWHYIGAPADADSVLAIGAVDSIGRYVPFSSQGPSADGRVKPNLAAQGAFTAVITPSGFVSRSFGTSFSCPVLAGMATGFWQAHPNLTAAQVRQLLQRSATQANNPDALLGYGIPNFHRADSIANAGPAGLPPTAAGQPRIYPNPVPGAAFGIELPAAMVGVALKVRVLDATGRVLVDESRTATSRKEPLPVTLKAGHLPAGTYLCEISGPGNGQRYVLRFVKE